MIIFVAGGSRRSSGRRCAPKERSTVTTTKLNYNPWLPMKHSAAVPIVCADEDTEVFFGPADSSENGKLFAWEKKALAFCAKCLIRQKCLAEALRHPVAHQYGVVGGMTASQRHVLLRDGRQKSVQAA